MQAAAAAAAGSNRNPVTDHFCASFASHPSDDAANIVGALLELRLGASAPNCHCLDLLD
jgi:hypothetical protein